MTPYEKLEKIAATLVKIEAEKLLVPDDQEERLEARGYLIIQWIMEQPTPECVTMKKLREHIARVKATWPQFRFNGGMGLYDDEDEKKWYEARNGERRALLMEIESLVAEGRADS